MAPWTGLTFFLGICLDSVVGHGRLIEPPSRSSMWKFGFPNPQNYDDNALYCGGKSHQWDVLGGLCGLCGDAYEGPRENEAGGKYANGIITRTYQPGAIINVTIDMTANHKGWMEFKICPNNNPYKPITQKCLDAHPLNVISGPAGPTRPGHRFNIKQEWTNMQLLVQLPGSLRCSQCVLQWKYHSGNSWGRDADGTECIGCGGQEEFYGCSDIAIGAKPIEPIPLEKRGGPGKTYPIPQNLRTPPPRSVPVASPVNAPPPPPRQQNAPVKPASYLGDVIRNAQRQASQQRKKEMSGLKAKRGKIPQGMIEGRRKEMPIAKSKLPNAPPRMLGNVRPQSVNQGPRKERLNAKPELPNVPPVNLPTNANIGQKQVIPKSASQILPPLMDRKHIPLLRKTMLPRRRLVPHRRKPVNRGKDITPRRNDMQEPNKEENVNYGEAQSSDEEIFDYDYEYDHEWIEQMTAADGDIRQNYKNKIEISKKTKLIDVPDFHELVNQTTRNNVNSKNLLKLYGDLQVSSGINILCTFHFTVVVSFLVLLY